MQERDEEFMKAALVEAEIAGQNGEVPVGACVVDSTGAVLGSAGNRTIIDSDPTGHAEVLAIRAASQKTGNYRLTDCTVYTTIEPCVMCAGALVNARISRLVFGAFDERFGAVRTRFGICDSPVLNHRMEITHGVLENECRDLIREFFRVKRKGSFS